MIVLDRAKYNGASEFVNCQRKAKKFADTPNRFVGKANFFASLAKTFAGAALLLLRCMRVKMYGV